MCPAPALKPLPDSWDDTPSWWPKEKRIFGGRGPRFGAPATSGGSVVPVGRQGLLMLVPIAFWDAGEDAGQFPLPIIELTCPPLSAAGSSPAISTSMTPEEDEKRQLLRVAIASPVRPDTSSPEDGHQHGRGQDAGHDMDTDRGFAPEGGSSSGAGAVVTVPACKDVELQGRILRGLAGEDFTFAWLLEGQTIAEAQNATVRLKPGSTMTLRMRVRGSLGSKASAYMLLSSVASAKQDTEPAAAGDMVRRVEF